MLNIQFETKIVRDYDSEEISPDVCLEVGLNNFNLSFSTIYIDIFGYECGNDGDIDAASKNKCKIGEMVLMNYSISRCGCGIFYNNFSQFACDSDLFEKMDINGDGPTYYEVLQKMYPKIRIDDDVLAGMDVEGHIVVLHRLFIDPEYRKKGIGTYLLKNFYNLVYNLTNISSVYVIGIICPDDKTEKMKNAQKRMLKRVGFKVAKASDGSDIFAKCTYTEDCL